MAAAADAATAVAQAASQHAVLQLLVHLHANHLAVLQLLQAVLAPATESTQA